MSDSKSENSRKLCSSSRVKKLDQPQDLTAPDIVTWLPVLLTASSANKINGPGQDTEENGPKTLEDGLVFRSPEMKRSLQRKKKTKKSSANIRPQDQHNSSSSEDSENSDSFYETLRKHQRKARTNSKSSGSKKS